MFGLLSVVAFALAFLMNIFGWGSGHFTWQAVMLAGFTCLAVHLLGGVPLPWRKQQ